jgi:hypothetical protein
MGWNNILSLGQKPVKRQINVLNMIILFLHFLLLSQSVRQEPTN